MLPKFFASAYVLLAAFFATLTPSSAHIVGISAPANITAGSNFTVTFQTASYIQNILEYYVVFGLIPSTFNATNSTGLNQLLGPGYDLIGNGHSNTLNGTFNVTVPMPASLPPAAIGQPSKLQAVVLSTVGISQSIWNTYWNTTVVVSQ